MPHFYDQIQNKPLSNEQYFAPDITEVSSAQQLAKTVGFPVEEPTKLPFSVSDTQYIAFDQSLAEISYFGENQNIVFRKATGTTDPSGNYTTYPQILALQLSNVEITLKGEADSYYLAIWQDGTFSYSIQSSDALSEAEWEIIIQSVLSQDK